MTSPDDIDFDALEHRARRSGGMHVSASEERRVSGDSRSPGERRGGRHRLIALNRSPLVRKIIIFNLIAMLVMVCGVLVLNPFRDSLVSQREGAIISETALVANVFEARLPRGVPINLATGEGIPVDEVMRDIELPAGAALYVFDMAGHLVSSSEIVGTARREPVSGTAIVSHSTMITDFLSRIWTWLFERMPQSGAVSDASTPQAMAQILVAKVGPGVIAMSTGRDGSGATIFSAARGLYLGGEAVGTVAMATASGEIDALVRAEREQVLQMFIVAFLVSIGLSFALASTIVDPLADLARMAEAGSGGRRGGPAPERVRIPDLTGRPDEIGRLSGALRGMVAALYDRIDSNERFAADVAHEIKNPLASLRSAVDSLHVVKREDQRLKLLQVIEQDVMRLDRLVSDISAASRLDSELVKEEQQSFDLVQMVGNICDYLGQKAQAKGIDFISDLPEAKIPVTGLEARLAQVLVNLITNAISFCGRGDAVRVWVRRRQNRVLVVVEDTGPGIPEEALTKVFDRFYSQRPAGQFGDHSGLGLAISKQIVEAHGGVIWAENIRPVNGDPGAKPLGARFVVGLPL